MKEKNRRGLWGWGQEQGEAIRDPGSKTEDGWYTAGTHRALTINTFPMYAPRLPGARGQGPDRGGTGGRGGPARF